VSFSGSKSGNLDVGLLSPTAMVVADIVDSDVLRGWRSMVDCKKLRHDSTDTTGCVTLTIGVLQWAVLIEVNKRSHRYISFHEHNGIMYIVVTGELG
jgi:hypothetical protein